MSDLKVVSFRFKFPIVGSRSGLSCKNGRQDIGSHALRTDNISNGWQQILLIMQDYVTGLEQLISSLCTLHLPHTATGAPDQPSKTAAAAPGLCILITLFCTDFRVFVNYQSVKNDSWRCWSECHGNQFRWNYFTLLIVFLFGLINQISRNHHNISRLRIEIKYSVIFALQRKQFSSSYRI